MCNDGEYSYDQMYPIFSSTSTCLGKGYMTMKSMTILKT